MAELAANNAPISADTAEAEVEEGELGVEVGTAATKKESFLKAIKQVQNDAKKLLKRQKKQASLKLAPDQLQKLLVVDDAEANDRSTSHTAFDEFDILEKGARLSLEEFDDIDSIKFGDTNDKINDTWHSNEKGKYFSFKVNRFAQAKSLVMKESEEMYALRQAVADLSIYINNFQGQLKRLVAAIRRRRTNLDELRKYIEKRQEQLMRYGFDEKLRLPYFLAGKLNVKIAELRIQILEESQRVLETRIFDAEALKTTTQVKLTTFPESKRKRKSWRAGSGFFSSPSKIVTSPKKKSRKYTEKLKFRFIGREAKRSRAARREQ